jgi:hypothetical protein
MIESGIYVNDDNYNQPYDYQFELPSDYMKFVGAFQDQKKRQPVVNYAIDSRKISTSKNFIYTDKAYVWTDTQNDNELHIYLWITYLSNDMEFFYTNVPIWFRQYFVLELASRICINLTGDTDLLKVIEARKETKRNKAYTSDSAQVEPRKIDSSKYLKHRTA